MRDLLHNPLCNATDLGEPIPDSAHATSVCLPLWQDNVGYEEGEPRVVDALRAGYPRFVFHPLTANLFRQCERQFGFDRCLAFPSVNAARRCLQFTDAALPEHEHIRELDGIFAVGLPEACFDRAKQYWQHAGEGVSSRLAAAAAAGQIAAPISATLTTIRSYIGELIDADPGDVYLYASGMAAGFTMFRALHQLAPERKFVQFGFPYVDTLKVLEKFGGGAHFFVRGDAAELDELETLLAGGERIGGLFCEFPGNPTLHSPDLQRLRTLADRYDFPIVVDDTIGTFANVSVLPIADAVTSSLTKHFSGVGDVMAGSLVLNAQQRFFEPLKTWLEADDAAFLYAEDAERLEANSRDFSERMVRFNANGEAFCDWLQAQPQIARVCYPKYQTDDAYDRCRRDHGGYGSLCSVIFENEAVCAPRFFDAVRVNKGPSLGTNYTLICPYTILAHYHELEFAEASGVSRYLVRVSIGLEDVEDLKSRFTAALA